MKKITTALLVMIMVMATALPASAQFAWGLKGGLNLANNKAGDLYTQGFSNTVSVENMTGFFIGPTMEVIAPVLGLGIDASLFYSQTGTKYRLGLLNDDKTTVTDKLHYLEIPVNLKYKFNLPIVGIYVGAGPISAMPCRANALGES